MIKSLVHIWFEPCVVGDASWHRHFSDMMWGLPESDIKSGNIAYIREDFMPSLKKYLPEKVQSLEQQIAEAEGQKQAAGPEVRERATDLEKE